MSYLAEKRERVKAILDDHDGINGYAYPPASFKRGDAWYTQGPLVVDQPTAQFTVNFLVTVVVPQTTEAAAYQWMSDHWMTLAEELAEEGFTDRVEMVGLATGDGTMWAVQFTLRSE
jgi:hypothetical protein